MASPAFRGTLKVAPGFASGDNRSGRFVLPVYEIYKAGHDVHWEMG
jgi:hypothetical protein